VAKIHLYCIETIDDYPDVPGRFAISVAGLALEVRAGRARSLEYGQRSVSRFETIARPGGDAARQKEAIDVRTIQVLARPTTYSLGKAACAAIARPLVAHSAAEHV
jgi:hypothetical protein